MFRVSHLTMQFILCGFLGWVAEIIFTGLLDTIKNKRLSLTATTYIWMFPIYGLLAFAYPPIHALIKGYEWYVRGGIYMVAFFVVEYVMGTALLKITGGYVWKYTSRYSINGLIQLPHAPVWFLAGLGFEKIYPYIVKISAILVS